MVQQMIKETFDSVLFCEGQQQLHFAASKAKALSCRLDDATTPNHLFLHKRLVSTRHNDFA